MTPAGRDWRRILMRGGAALTAAGAVACLAGAILDPKRAAASYLAVYAAAMGVAVATLLLFMIVELSGGLWFAGLRRHAEAVIATLPVLAVLFIPVLLSARVVYPWLAAPDAIPPSLVDAVRAKRAYLSPGFSLARAIVYWLAWIGLGELVRRASIRRDVDADEVSARRLRAVCAAAIPVVALALTFAAFDWLMSLSPDWTSSVYGVYFFAGGAVGGLALLCVFAGVRLRLDTASALSTEELRALGNLLLAFVLFWGYLAYAQFLIVWIANLPTEVGWYTVRTHGGWGVLGGLLLAGHLLVPSLALTGMLGLGGWMLVMHYADVYWLVVPTLSPTPVAPWWDLGWDLGALLLVTGSTLAVAAWRYARQPLAFSSAPSSATPARRMA